MKGQSFALAFSADCILVIPLQRWLKVEFRILTRNRVELEHFMSRWIFPVVTLSTFLVLTPSVASAAMRELELSQKELSESSWSGGLISNSAFLPSAKAMAAHEPFQGTLILSEVEMSTAPGEFKSRNILGKDPKIFPMIKLGFFSHQGDLVPVTQDVIRAGTLVGGKSYWDTIVQAGKIWSEPSDDGWSRASFPFALMNSLEGETHNGIATFMYKGKDITHLHVQIVQQTSPFYVEDYFTASANVPITLDPSPVVNIRALEAKYERSLNDAIPIKAWADLAKGIDASKLNGFDSAINPNEIVLDGIAVNGTFYLRTCASAAGPLAYCDRQRFGIWSVTKAAANGVALLRLAQKYGHNVFDAKIADYVQEAASYPGWKDVTFGDALNMATGLGNGTTNISPNNIVDGYLDTTYAQWYEARTERQKIDSLLKIAKIYPWGPGKVVRYRDQDMFILGAAMQRYYQSKEGPKADLWSMIQKEVYEPIGIHYSPINRTIESNGSAGQPLLAYGMYATISDLVKIAQLYQNGGKHNGVQILSVEKLADVLPNPAPRGLGTGRAKQSHYYKALWYSEFKGQGGCSIYYPSMLGWGGNYVTMFPHGATAVRIAKNWNGEDEVDDTSSMAAVADRLYSFCN